LQQGSTRSQGLGAYPQQQGKYQIPGFSQQGNTGSQRLYSRQQGSIGRQAEEQSASAFISVDDAATEAKLNGILATAKKTGLSGRHPKELSDVIRSIRDAIAALTNAPLDQALLYLARSEEGRTELNLTREQCKKIDAVKEAAIDQVSEPVVEEALRDWYETRSH
jgi:hypothetical protein